MEQAVYSRIDSDQITFDVPEMVPINANGKSYWMGCHTETSETDLKAALGTLIYNDFRDDGHDHTDYYDADCESDEQPLHKITFGYDFAVSKYEITFDEWDACVKDEGDDSCTYKPADQGWGRVDRPVINVSWE
ncbi:MAG: SUMF1/EgtB/PvdO family nonheme iron enzyme, partial [bacterium]|nr:SUMF1/EgtB/PvdO family nonheme iron enzyme [bacterium]